MFQTVGVSKLKWLGHYNNNSCTQQLSETSYFVARELFAQLSGGHRHYIFIKNNPSSQNWCWTDFPQFLKNPRSYTFLYDCIWYEIYLNWVRMRMDQEGQQVIKNPVHSVLVRDRQQNVYWLRAHVQELMCTTVQTKV